MDTLLKQDAIKWYNEHKETVKQERELKEKNRKELLQKAKGLPKEEYEKLMEGATIAKSYTRQYHAEYYKEYYQRKKEHLKAVALKYYHENGVYEKNKEVIKARVKDWTRAKKEKEKQSKENTV